MSVQIILGNVKVKKTGYPVTELVEYISYGLAAVT